MKGHLSYLAVPGSDLAVRVTPNARRAGVEVVGGLLKVAVTVVPEGGKANRAVQEALAEALGVAKSRLRLIRGETARDKVFRLD